MGLINDKDEILLYICVETPGFPELDRDSGKQNTNCVFAMLSKQGYTSASLGSSGEKDWASLAFLCELVYADKQIANKMHPCCLKLATITQKRKLKVSSNLGATALTRRVKTLPHQGKVYQP